MKKFLLSATLVLACLYGCDSNRDVSADKSAMPGSDVDEHGCKASAGYSWCERTGQCERPWELAEKEGFENTSESFDAYCSEQ